MSAITLKTAARDTQVSRLEVRAAIAAVYSKKDAAHLRDRKTDRSAGKSGVMTSVKAAKR